MIKREERIHRLGSYWQKKYGERVYKIILNGNFTCPNIEQNKGCIFCNMNSMQTLIAKEQGQNTVLENQSYLKNRNNAKLFYAYFQDYSATYPLNKKQPLNYLEKIYRQAFELDNIIGVSIGSRADTITPQILDLLVKLKKEYQKDLILEIGLQSIVEKDLIWINRGHTLETYLNCIKLLKSYNIETVSHLILGLPHETNQSIIKTAQLINKIQLNGIKIHQLMILKNTPLATLYERQQITTLTQQEYLEKLTILLGYLNPKTVIHRLYGDAPKNELIAPTWCQNKTALQDIILNYFVKTDFWQGKFIKSKISSKTKKY